MYYLRSRYYDPAVKRFINADSVGYLGVDFGNRTAGTYHHSYVRMIPLIGAAALVYATYGAILSALQPALAR